MHQSPGTPGFAQAVAGCNTQSRAGRRRSDLLSNARIQTKGRLFVVFCRVERTLLALPFRATFSLEISKTNCRDTTAAKAQSGSRSLNPFRFLDTTLNINAILAGDPNPEDLATFFRALKVHSATMTCVPVVHSLLQEAIPVHFTAAWTRAASGRRTHRVR